jgi:1-acyl-sn-glycerol-3-phosphate acyltransferase/long-chain acyl-CoA synthetase
MTVHGHQPRALQRAFEWFSRTVFRFYAPLQVTVCEPLPDEPFVLCSNHSSHLDSAVLMVASGLPFHAFRLLAAADYFDPQSRAGRLTRAVLHIVTIDRSSGRSASIRGTIAECGELVRDHQVRLIAFPEGTRSVTGDLLPFKRGAALLGVALGLPVVPAYIEGARDALPKGSWMPRPRPIRVQFGRAIRPEEWTGVHSHKERCDYVARELEQRITDLARARSA